MKKHFIQQGDRFGHLTVVSEQSRKDHEGVVRRYVQVRCDCGKELEVYMSNLIKENHTTSCGCFGAQTRRDAHTTHGHSCRTGGIRRTRTYRTWEAMKQRCYNPNNRDYINYGQRGISICPRWLESFENFLDDMGEASSDLYIDRIDNDGNYEPSNCRWATAMQQVYNRRCTKRLEYKGKEYTIREFSDMTGIKYGTIERRLAMGWTIERAVETPIHSH